MNTDTTNVPNENNVNQVETLPVATIGEQNTPLEVSLDVENNLVQLVEALQDVDSNSPDAEANATSISDNNGGRIELNEDLAGPNVIKK